MLPLLADPLFSPLLVSKPCPFRLVAGPTKRYELSECLFYLNKVKRYQI